MKVNEWVNPKPSKCDLCSSTLDNETVFYDARIHTGQWGTLCESCHDTYGVGLGEGKGQKYCLNTLKKLEG